MSGLVRSWEGTPRPLTGVEWSALRRGPPDPSWEGTPHESGPPIHLYVFIILV